MLRYELLLPGFALVLARTAGIALAVPMFASSQIPVQMKAALAFVLALVAYPVVAPALPGGLSLGKAAAGMVGEFVIGEVIGLGAGVLFFAAQFAGKIVSHQTGLSLGAVFNPIYDSESSVLDQLWFFTALMFFFVVNGHLAVVQAMLDSFYRLPPMSSWDNGLTVDFFTGTLTSIFDFSLRLAGPVILALLLALIAMGVLMKTMPQFNILSVGFSLKIAIGMLVMAVTLRASDGVMSDAVTDGLGRIGLWFDQASSEVLRGG